MRILISGINGFVGRHLVEHLQKAVPDADLHGTVFEPAPARANIVFHKLDLRDADAVTHLIEQVRPDHIYHLAAQASPRLSFSRPWETLENNIRSQLNLILGCLNYQLRPRILITSSAEIYGSVHPDQLPIHEDFPLRPTNPYGVSKVTQDLLGLQYFLSHQMPIVRVRPFNHIGPGQSEGFVATDFARQIARIEAGQQEPRMDVGNLSAQRDFTDVRDVVRAYHLIMEQGVPGAVYNVASGKPYSIQHLLDSVLHHSLVPITVYQDPARMLPIDIPIIQGDASRLNKLTGWEPSIPFETTLLDILNDWRTRVRQV